MKRYPPRFTLFPYTTLFRSGKDLVGRGTLAVDEPVGEVTGAQPDRLERDGHDRRSDGREHRAAPSERSEEHTSELQSRRDLVCRLLLEKKKTQITHTYNYND